jgi:TldD protein
MKDIATWALNVANKRGATYADARVVSQRSRALTTKNGKVGSASDTESVGMNVRVLADGAWGFAASEDRARVGAGEAERRSSRARKGGNRRMDHSTPH